MENKKRFFWIPNHPEHEWWPGEVVSDETDKFYILIDEKDQQFKVEKSKALHVDPDSLKGVSDLLLLEDLNEGSLLHNIRQRYAEDEIYTAIGGPIIVSVNPYKNLPIYGLSIVSKYNKSVTQMRLGNLNPHEVPPHLYKIAETSYQSLMETKKSQSIIISGESGSGKTEAAKFILKYLTQTSHQEINTKARPAEDDIEKKVLDSNPILEAFGNAKTIRNDNSSRFGKFIEINFDRNGRINSANIVNYLLEKSRLVSQQPGERNYHIFYQLCYGATNQERELYKIEKPDAYRYLSRDKDEDTDQDINDVEDFKQTRECIKALGFSNEEKDQIFRLVAGIMHLGNVEFNLKPNTNSEAAEISKISYPYLENSSKMLGVTVQDLANVCCFKIIPMPNVSEVVRKEFTVQEAYKIRDGLVKDTYGKFFDWLVYKVNQSITRSSIAKEKSKFVLGILDIFGFEIFQRNSFEQLCINYTNEKLQQHFNNHIFKIEQEEYQREGINWNSISFADNLQTISLIDHPTNSLFSLLEEECLVPKGSDMNFINKVYTKLGSSRAMSTRNNRNQALFGIKHYAGEVYYDCTNFLEKNKDTVNPDFVSLFLKSDNSLLRLIFSAENNFVSRGLSAAKQAKPAENSQKSQPGSIKGATLTAKFKTQLAELLEALNDTNPAYIRCIKPNGLKSPGIFDSIDVMRQLKCAGILEAIKIRKDGFPIRKSHKDFLSKYGRIFPDVGNIGNFQAIQAFFNKAMGRQSLAPKLKNLWGIGKTKVFMKEEVIPILEHELYLSIKKFVQRLQKFARNIIMKLRWKRIRYIFRIKRNIKKVLFRGFKQKVVNIWKRKMAFKIFTNWKIVKQNRRTLLRRKKWFNAISLLKGTKNRIEYEQSGQSVNIEPFSENYNSMFSADDSFTKTPMSMSSKNAHKKTHNRGSSGADGPVKDLIKKMQDELDYLRQENSELKSRATVTRLSKFGNEIYDKISQGLGPSGFDVEGLIYEVDAEQSAKHIQKVEQLEKALFEKESLVETLNTKLTFMAKSYETLERENKHLKDDSKKRDNILQQKLQLEIDIKAMERQQAGLLGKIEQLEEDVRISKEKMKEKDERVLQITEKMKKVQFNCDELGIKYSALKEQEDFFRKEAAKKDLELREKIEERVQLEEQLKEMHNKVKDASIANLDIKSQLNFSFRADEKFDLKGVENSGFSGANNEQIEDLQQTITHKNMKIFKLTKENQISKEINQTLVKLLKLKNVQIQTIKIINTEQDNTKKTEAQNNLEKFQNEEKKLLRMLDSLMKQYETLESKKE